MYSESDIDGAVTAGAITPAAAEAFRMHVAASHATPAVDEEHFRLLTGFNDIFVSIALVLLLVAVGQIGQSIASGLGGGLMAAASWLLALYFTARRRMALPSILLLLAFVGGIAAAQFGVFLSLYSDLDGTRTGALALAGMGMVCAAAAWLHWRRFMVPITVAAGAAALVTTGIGIVMAIIPTVEQVVWPLLLIGGLGVFAAAMRWDMSDTARQTRRSDVAFWLHLAAAPMIAHSVFQMLGVFRADIGAGMAILVLALYVVFAVIALAVDRRALLVSGLAYVLAALYALFSRAGAIELGAALTAFVIGSALLCLSAFWQPMRRIVVTALPPSLQNRLPPVSGA